jgi:hypothetical protein
MLKKVAHAIMHYVQLYLIMLNEFIYGFDFIAYMNENINWFNELKLIYE